MSQKRFTALCTATVSLLLFAAPWSQVRADYLAYKCESPHSTAITPIIKNNACIGYKIGAAKGRAPSSVMFDFPGSGKLIASEDGRTVVMIQSYLYGSVDEDGDIVGFRGGASEKNPVAIYVYRDGRRVATHRIHELVVRRNLVWPSTSHLKWLNTAPKKIRGESFVLTTTSLRKLTFNTRTGQLQRQENAPAWNDCNVIAAGTLDSTGSKLTRPFNYKTGRSSEKPLRFERKSGVKLTHRAFIVGCFERRGKTLVLTQQL